MDDLISRAAARDIFADLHGLCRNDVLRDTLAKIDAITSVDAVPVGWLIDRANDPERAPLYRRYAQMLYEEWQKEQEART